jgi:hypothetical protein
LSEPIAAGVLVIIISRFFSPAFCVYTTCGPTSQPKCASKNHKKITKP